MVIVMYKFNYIIMKLSKKNNIIIALLAYCLPGIANSMVTDPELYGRDASLSVSSISGDELRKSHSWNLLAALQGRLPGLIVSANSTNPSEESYSILIRGNSTMNGNTPLVVLDGMIGADIGSINVQDVESVSILKDAAATAMYGMRGANGVIVIKTKRGASGKPNINVNLNYTAQQALIKPDFLNSYQYASLMNEAAYNMGLGNNYYYSEDDLLHYKNGDDLLKYPNQNWYDRYVQDFVHTMQANVSASGGNKRMKYYANIAYRNQGNPYNTEESERYNNQLRSDTYNYRTNVDVAVNDYLNVYMNLSGQIVRKRDTNFSRGEIYTSIFKLNPTMNGPLTEDGQVITLPTIANPTYGQINRSGYVQNTASTLNVQLGADLDLKFLLKGLRAKANIAYYTVSNSNVMANHDYERWIRNTENKDEVEFIKYGSNENSALTLTKSNSNSYVTDFNGSLYYDKNFGVHSIYAEAFLRTQNYSQSSAVTDQSNVLPSIYMTYGGGVNYNYNNVLSANVYFTYDGSEQFARENRYHFFPSASLAWIPSNHSFMDNVDFIDFLKIRASIGQVGNDIMGADKYPYKDKIQGGGSGFIGELGNTVVENYKGNINICPEVSTIYNIGIETNFLDNWSFGIDLFRDNRNKILLDVNTIPDIYGWSSSQLAPRNTGKVRNQGVELTLGYNKSFNPNFEIWGSGFFTYSKNEILKAEELIYPEDYAYRTRLTGFEIGTRWGYEVDYSNGNGFFNSAQEIADSKLVYQGAQPRVGDLKYVDQNNDDIIDQKDLVPFEYTGTPNINWGLNLGARYKRFDINVLFQGEAMKGATFSGCGFYESFNNGTFFEKHLYAWTQERYDNGEKILVPALSTSASSSHTASTFYNRNMNYFRLKNLEIGYTFPISTGEKVRDCRLYISAYNLLTFDKLPDMDQMDPESGFAQYPVSRYFNVGVNLNF